MSPRKRIKVRLTVAPGGVENTLCRLAARAIQTALRDGDLAEIEAELDAMDEVLGPDPRRTRGEDT